MRKITDYKDSDFGEKVKSMSIKQFSEVVTGWSDPIKKDGKDEKDIPPRIVKPTEKEIASVYERLTGNKVQLKN